MTVPAPDGAARLRDALDRAIAAANALADYHAAKMAEAPGSPDDDDWDHDGLMEAAEARAEARAAARAALFGPT